MTADLQFNKTEYGYTINRTLNESVSAATSVQLICNRAGVNKTITGTVSGGTTVSFVVTDGFFDTPGFWFCKVRANFASRISEEKEPVLIIEITD
jgi:hypothetical protein